MFYFSSSVFEFLGFSSAPHANVDKYMQEIQMGLYPSEIKDLDNEKSQVAALPWSNCLVEDPVLCMSLVEELLHLIIILITASTIWRHSGLCTASSFSYFSFQ